MLYRLPNYFFNSVFFAVSMPGSGEFSFCSQFYLEKPLTKAISYDILITEQRKREMRCTPLIWLHQKTYAEKERTAHHRASFFVVLQTGERLSSFLTGFDKDIMADRTVKQLFNFLWFSRLSQDPHQLGNRGFRGHIIGLQYI